MLGPVEITIGDHCHISGAVTITGRANGPKPPNSSSAGTAASDGRRPSPSAGRSASATTCASPDAPCSPVIPAIRSIRERGRPGLPDTEDQIGDIVLEDDVWLGTGATVSAGVTIGKGTIVAAGSVVTKDLPPGVLAAGVPAKVIRKLEE